MGATTFLLWLRTALSGREPPGPVSSRNMFQHWFFLQEKRPICIAGNGTMWRTTRTRHSGQALGFCQDFLNTPSQLKLPLGCLAASKADWDCEGAGRLASRLSPKHQTRFN